TSAEFNIKCQNYGLKHSYSLKGHPYDNGCMEAFHSILKREEVYLKAYQTLTEVQAAIGWYINLADCKIKPNTLHKKAAETLMVIDQNQP
ncbi:transposase, partial [Leuconostoc mesenteroides]|nr:transposase [Leuconostoc mesenteroides]